jgi:hypothetical protein
MGNIFKDAAKEAGRGINNALEETNRGIETVMDPVIDEINRSFAKDTGKELGRAGGSLDVNKPQRDAKNKQQAEIDKQKKITDDAGRKELTLWESTLKDVDKYDPDAAALTPADIAALDKTQKTQEARVAGIMAQFGLSDSTMAVGMMNDIDNERLIAGGQILNEHKKFILTQKITAFQIADSHFKNALTALGLSNALVQQAAQVDAQYYGNLMNAWNGLVGATATVAGAYFGGPAGAAAGAAIFSAKPSTINSAPNGYNMGTPTTFGSYPGIDY